MRSVLFKMIPVLFLVGIGMVSYSFFRAHNVGANIFELYPTECDGGFANASLASGNVAQEQPDTYFIGVHNAALFDGTSQAELRCGKFIGEVPSDSAPTSVTVKFAWLATYDRKILEQVPLVPLLDPLATSTASTTDVLITAPMDEQATESVQAPIGGGSSSEEAPTPSVPQDSTLPIDESLLPLQPTSSSSTPATTTEVVVNPETPPLSPAPPVEASPVLPTKESSPPVAPEVLPTETPKEENPGVAPEVSPVESPTSTPPPPESAPPVSFLEQVLFRKAFADEVAIASELGSESSSSATSSHEIVGISEPQGEGTSSTTSLEAVVVRESNATSTSGVVEVLYTLGTAEWKSLGFVLQEEFQGKDFTIPLASSTSWEDLKNVEIAIRSQLSTDGVSPIILVDGVWLEVSYGDYPDDPHPIPDVHRGDVFRGIAKYEDFSAVVVDRTVAFATSTATSTELWLLDETSTTTPSWMFIADKELFPADAKVFFRYGQIFWSSGKGNLWVFNPKANAYDSQSFNEGESCEYQFTDEAGGKKVLIISALDGSFAFEDYIPEPQSE